MTQEQFTRWLIKNKVKLKDWPTDKMYLLFVQDHCKRESVERALERYVESAMATDYFETFWETANGYLIADWVEMGKISPGLLLVANELNMPLKACPLNVLLELQSVLMQTIGVRSAPIESHDAHFVQEMIDGAILILI